MPGSWWFLCTSMEDRCAKRATKRQGVGKICTDYYLLELRTDYWSCVLVAACCAKFYT